MNCFEWNVAEGILPSEAGAQEFCKLPLSLLETKTFWKPVPM